MCNVRISEEGEIQLKGRYEYERLPQKLMQQKLVSLMTAGLKHRMSVSLPLKRNMETC
jgi:hypothetical protein